MIEENYDSPWSRSSGIDNERVLAENYFNEVFETDVPGLYSDGTYKKGIDSYPVFNVNNKEFSSNMEEFRKRMRFTGKAAEYLRNTRYTKSFYIRYVDEQTNKAYLRKVK